MKKLLLALLIAMMGFGTVGCGDDDVEVERTPAGGTDADD